MQQFVSRGSIVAAATLVTVFLGTLPARAVNVTLVGDSFTQATAATRTKGTKKTIELKGPIGGPADKSGWVIFDLSTLPPGTTAANVSLATLTMFTSKIRAPGSFDVVRVGGAWDEATITFAGAPILGVTEQSGVPVAAKNTFATADVTAVVQDWVDGALTNNGLALVPNAVDGLDARFDSKEGKGQAPRLEITLIDLTDDAVTNPKLATNAVTSDKISDGTIATADLANGSVTNPKLAANAVASDKIQDGTVDNADLANNSVNSIKIADGSVSGADIANSTITSADVDINSVQVRVGGACSSGDAIQSVNNNGSVSCSTSMLWGCTNHATGTGTSGGTSCPDTDGVGDAWDPFNLQCSLSCPAGKVLVSGGGRCFGSTWLASSFTYTGGVWEVGCINSVGTRSAPAYYNVVCCNN